MRESIRTPKETELEKRFAERMEIGGEETTIIDIGSVASDRPPVLVAPGFNASIHTNAPMLEMLAKESRIISLNHPHTGDEPAALSEEDTEKTASRFARTEVRKASNLLELIEKRGVNERVNCLAFSEGALNTLIAAYLHPEKFNSIILSAPAGLIGHDNILSLALRFRSQGKSDETAGIPSRKEFVSDFPELAAEEEKMIQHIADTWKEDEAEAMNHKMRTIEDLWALSTTRIDDLVTFARAAGIKVAVISGVDDQVFPTKTMAERLPTGSLDGFLSVRGAHGPQYSARIVNYLFELLNKKSEREG